MPTGNYLPRTFKSRGKQPGNKEFNWLKGQYALFGIQNGELSWVEDSGGKHVSVNYRTKHSRMHPIFSLFIAEPDETWALVKVEVVLHMVKGRLLNK